MDVHKHLETRRAAAAALSEDCTAASAGEFGDCAFVYYRFRHNLSSAGFAWQTRPNDPDVSLVFGAAQRRFARLVVSTTEGAADAATTGIGLASLVSCQAVNTSPLGDLAEVPGSTVWIGFHSASSSQRGVHAAKVRALIDEVGGRFRMKFG